MPLTGGALVPAGEGGVVEVDVPALARAADAAREAGALMGGVDLSGDAELIGSAVPGGTAVGAAGALSASWDRGVRGWSRAVIAHGDALAAAGASYRHGDTAAGGVIAAALEPGG